MTDRNAIWTPMGLDITGAKSVEEVLNRADINFTVDKSYIYDSAGNVIPGYIANRRSDNNNLLGIVSNKYTIVQNSEAFDFINNLVPEGIEFERGGVWHNGTAVWIEAKLPNTVKILDDDIESHIIFINSHNGKGSVRVCMLPNRVVCANQLNFALKTAQRAWSAVHSSQVNYKLKTAAETLGLADKYMTELTKSAEELAAKKFTETEFINLIDKMYPLNEDDSNRKITNVSEIRSGLIDCYHSEDNSNFVGTAWGALGAVTDYFDHSAPQRATAIAMDAKWEKIANGYSVVDKFYTALAA